MKFGITLMVHYPYDSSPSEEWDRYLEKVRLARDCGFKTITHGDHSSADESSRAPGRPRVFPILARWAAESGDMTLALSVALLPLHHPLELAEDAATLDVITHGRFILGVGTGWRPLEFHARGIPIEERIPRFVETLEIMKRLWTESHVTHQGHHFQFNNITIGTKPVQKPRLPIWFGTSSPGGVRRAAELAEPEVGDTLILTSRLPAPLVEREMEIFNQGLEARGKPRAKELPLLRVLFIAPDRESAIQASQPWLERTYRWWNNRGLFPELARFWGKEWTHEEQVPAAPIIGSPDDCVQAVGELQQKLGIEHLIFQLPWANMEQSRIEHTKMLKTIELLGAKVIPHFKERTRV
ncbi:MAG: LLM class flavin-dependent oxidoreductase [Chloroflexi bacterium]|nr:LLM class flavin-dependent oxidoreductase [Chloroflexota bacterium]